MRESMVGQDKQAKAYWHDKHNFLLHEQERVKTYLAIIRDVLGTTLAGLTSDGNR